MPRARGRSGVIAVGATAAAVVGACTAEPPDDATANGGAAASTTAAVEVRLPSTDLSSQAAALDFSLASPWASIADLAPVGDHRVSFTMWETPDVACEVEGGQGGHDVVITRTTGDVAPVPSDVAVVVESGGTQWSLATGATLVADDGAQQVRIEIPLPAGGIPRDTWRPGGLAVAGDGTVWFAVWQYRTHTNAWYVGHVATEPSATPPVALTLRCDPPATTGS